jgi:FkbM family methyltransferase
MSSDVLQGGLDRFVRFVKWVFFKIVCLSDYPRYLSFRGAIMALLGKIGLYEGPEFACLPLFIRDGSEVLDIGAHFGLYTYKARQLVGAGGKVIAFEPLPELFALLEERFSRDQGILVRRAAVSAEPKEEGTLRIPLLFGSMPEPALASSSALFAESREVTVPFITVDSLLPDLSNLSFIKMDVEGAEPSVLRGASKVIHAFRPVIQLEENSPYQNLDFYFDWARKYGYALHRPLGRGSFGIIETADGMVGRTLYLIPQPRPAADASEPA